MTFILFLALAGRLARMMRHVFADLRKGLKQRETSVRNLVIIPSAGSGRRFQWLVDVELFFLVEHS